MTDATLNRRRLLAGSGALLLTGGLRPPRRPEELTPQDWATGTVLWDGGYADYPYIVPLPSGELLSTLTVSDGSEGSDDQHTIVLSSIDRGATWTQISEMEPASAPESSWGMPWLHGRDRLYVFYTYNAANVRFVPASDGDGGTGRVDLLGVVAYRSSIDSGRTWTERRHLDLPAHDIDRRNPWGGAHRLLWLSGYPVSRGDAGYFGLSKWGQVGHAAATLADSEAFVVKVWETAPGVLASKCSAPIRTTDPINEEPAPVVFEDGLISATFRTTAGRMGEAWSDDDGATWTVDWARDEAGVIIPQPRAKAAQFRLPDGRVFLWGHNNASVPEDNSFLGPRNPVFYRIGRRDGQRISWAEPLLLLWDRDSAKRISYPSLVVDRDEVLIAATDKATAKLFRFPPTAL